MPDQEKRAQKRRVFSIEVGFRILRVLEADDHPLPLKDIAARAGMSASKAHLYLSSFIHEGMVEQNPETGHYGLGAFATQLGLSAVRRVDVVQQCRPILKNLNDATGCGGYLSLWTDRGPVIAAKIDGESQGAMTIKVGYIFSGLSSISSLVFHAYLPESIRKSATPRAMRTDELPTGDVYSATKLKTVRTAGYAMGESRIYIGYTSIAAPVFDYAGELAATLTLLVPTRNLASKQMKTYPELLREAAHELSVLIGHRPSK